MISYRYMIYALLRVLRMDVEKIETKAMTMTIEHMAPVRVLY